MSGDRPLTEVDPISDPVKQMDIWCIMARGYSIIGGLLIVALLMLWSGCAPQNEIRDALKQLAPDGGSGIKRYFYETGELKEEDHWKDYEIVRVVYFGKDGRELFTCVPDHRSVLLITLNENGEITQIYEATDFVKDGRCFVIVDGALQKIQTWQNGKVISEIAVPSTDQRIPTSKESGSRG